MIKRYRQRQRPFSLMEVMISFVLILFCLVPLIYPNIAMYREQNKFTEKIQLDHAVTVLYGNLLEAVHRRSIPFEQLIQSTSQPIAISPEALSQAGFDPNKSAYTLSLTAQKDLMKGDKTGRYIAALVKFTYRFQNKTDAKDTITFTYLTPVVKLKPPSEQSTEDDNNQEKTPPKGRPPLKPNAEAAEELP